MDDNNFVTVSYGRLCQMITHSMQMEKLSLRNCGFQDILCDYLTAPLIINRKMKEIDLSGNELTDRGIMDICKQLDVARKVKIHTIKLNGNNITDRGATRLLESLRLNQSEIQEIEMADNSLSDQFVPRLAEYLKIMRAHEIFWLKKFDITGNGIGMEGMAIAEKELLKNQQAQVEYDMPIEEARIKKMKIQARQRKGYEERSGRAQSELTYNLYEMEQYKHNFSNFEAFWRQQEA